MNRFRGVFSVYLVIGLMVFGFVANADGQDRRNQREVRNILRDLNSRIDDFRFELDNEFRRTPVNRNEQNEINNNIEDLENNISKFEGKLQRRRESADKWSRTSTKSAWLAHPVSHSIAPIMTTTNPLNPIFLRITFIATPSTGIIYRTLFLPLDSDRKSVV